LDGAGKDGVDACAEGKITWALSARS